METVAQGRRNTPNAPGSTSTRAPSENVTTFAVAPALYATYVRAPSFTKTA